ncbi:molybdopterin molybdotransferase MoeA [soil metagenome]
MIQGKSKSELTTVTEAYRLISEQNIMLENISVKLAEAYGRILSKDIVAPIALPPFDQSAMDGYAIRFEDLEACKEFNLAGEVAAGDIPFDKVEKGYAVRIFTGAALPSDLDTVIIQEEVTISNGKITFAISNVVAGQNVRITGAQIAEGEIALEKGHILTAGGIGYLGALGVKEVVVTKLPVVEIIVTGNELKMPGEDLLKGQIYESNSVALTSALFSCGISGAKISFASDDLNEIRTKIDRALEQSDILLITGGVSVGDYDFTGKALQEIGVKNIFYKIAQKPGKPLYFGRKDNKLVFGLPGNPASVLSCFYEYVYPVLRKMQGLKGNPHLFSVMLPLGEDLKKKPGLTLFLKGQIVKGEVYPLSGQESFILSSFAHANCLIRISAESDGMKQGDLVECHLLPQ